MPMLEDAKKIAEKVTGWARPSRANLSALVRERKASTFHFKDDRIIPTTRNGRSSFIAGQCGFRKISIRRPYSKNCSKATGGAIPGVTGTEIIIVADPPHPTAEGFDHVKKHRIVDVLRICGAALSADSSPALRLC
jgi:hypothetical protein